MSGLNTIDWPSSLKEQQRNWIGKSHGFTINFRCLNSKIEIPVFTTRADTIFGVTFLVLSPDHNIIEEIVESKFFNNVKEYIELSRKKSEREKIANINDVSGVFTGAFAINPFLVKKFQFGYQITFCRDMEAEQLWLSLSMMREILDLQLNLS